MARRIVVTGGSGKAGRHVIQYLLQRGHSILNLDRVPLPDISGFIHTLIVDLTDSGQVFNGISSRFKSEQPFTEPLFQPPDAVIHLGGYARNMMVADNETFRGNAIGTYNVIEAACKLGVKKIIIASSVCAYGVTYAEGDVDFPSFPIDEALEVHPMDTYGISKVCGEVVAKGFAARYGIDIYVLRIGNVLGPDEYDEVFHGYVNNAEEWKVHGWSYIDARDLGQICDLCVSTNGHGYQIFNATNDEITNTTPTKEFLSKECPNTPFTREMGPREAPISNRKIKELLGFREEHNWRLYYKP